MYLSSSLFVNILLLEDGTGDHHAIIILILLLFLNNVMDLHPSCGTRIPTLHAAPCARIQCKCNEQYRRGFNSSHRFFVVPLMYHILHSCMAHAFYRPKSKSETHVIQRYALRVINEIDLRGGLLCIYVNTG